MTATLTPPEVEEQAAPSAEFTPSSEFILKRILKNDMQGTPGWRLNPEMRGEFTRMLLKREQGRGR